MSENLNRNKRAPWWGVAPIEVADEALMTASGGNLIRAEINRNKRAPLWGVAPIEVAENMTWSKLYPENKEESK